jgi:hypothetical protein
MLWLCGVASAGVFKGKDGVAPTPAASGAWTISKNYVYRTDVPLATAVAALINTTHRAQGDRRPTALDLGAGTGHYVRFLREHNIRAFGREGATNAEEMSGGLVRQADLSMPLVPCKPYDWVLNLEVAEHIPREREANLLYNLNCSCKHGLVVSWGAPGQSGVVRCRARTRSDAVAAAGGADVECV